MAFSIYFGVLLGFLVYYSSSALNNIINIINIIYISILDMVIPSIVLVSVPGGEEPGGEESSSPDVNWESNCEKHWREGFSDESDDSETTRDLKKRIREGKSEWNLMKRE